MSLTTLPWMLLAISLSAASESRVAPPLPVALAEIERLDQGEGIDVDRTVVTDGNGNGWIVYEHMDADFTRSELRSVRFQRCGSRCLDYSPPVRLSTPTASNFVSAPSFVTAEGHTWLYFVEADGFRTPASLWRASFQSGKLTKFENVRLEGDVTAWAGPWLARTSAGQYGVILRHRGSSEVAFSSDGVTFGQRQSVAEETGSTPAIAAFDDGRWVIAFQHGPMAKMRSYFRIANTAGSDLPEWSERRLVYAESDNVHNTLPVARTDGRVDLYFLTPPGDWRGFAIHRRCLEKDGVLGQAQMVVPYEFGNLLEPHVARIAPDLLLLTFNEQRTGHRLHAAPLADDAACPSDPR